PRFIMRRMRRMYGRAAPDSHEINILRGILTSVEEALGLKPTTKTFPHLPHNAQPENDEP
ncbi:hypothetical protein NQU49_25875, partial [Escherichia coli]|nr:hypothetical protein [Escherichia coli]